MWKMLYMTVLCGGASEVILPILCLFWMNLRKVLSRNDSMQALRCCHRLPIPTQTAQSMMVLAFYIFFCLVKFFNTLKSLLIIKERDKMHYFLSFTATVFQPLATEFSICCFPAVEYSVAALVSNSI